MNLHHFVLDGAIWKLRSGRIARVLLRPREAPASTGAPRHSWLGRGVWATGAACLGIVLLAHFEQEAARRAIASGDLARARTAAKRLDWIGRDGPALHVTLGSALERSGQSYAALVEYQQAIALHPTVGAWHALGSFHARQGRWNEAAAAYEAALGINPDEKTVLHHLGVASLELGRPERARQAFARAAELDPGRKIHRIMLERAERALLEAVPAQAANPG